MDGVTKIFFLFLFMMTIFQLEPWTRMTLDSHQLTVEEGYEYKCLHKAILQSAVIAFQLKGTGVEFV